MNVRRNTKAFQKSISILVKLLKYNDSGHRHY